MKSQSISELFNGKEKKVALEWRNLQTQLDRAVKVNITSSETCGRRHLVMRHAEEATASRQNCQRLKA